MFQKIDVTKPVYHYLYRIDNLITGEFYYGIHSTNNVDDGYFGSGIELKRNITKYGRDNFKKTILEYRDTRDEILELEEKLVDKELLSNPKCLNMFYGGNACKATEGWICVVDENGEKFAVQNTDPEYLSGKLKHVNTGNTAVLGYIRITKNGTDKMVPPEKLNEYLKDGWIKGSFMKGRVSPTKGMVHIKNGDKEMMCPVEELLDYKAAGWVEGRVVSPCKNKIGITKDGKDKYVYPHELQTYLDKGWKEGMKSRNAGLTLMVQLDGTHVMVNRKDPIIQEKIANGELLSIAAFHGSAGRGTTYMHKDGVFRRIKNDKVLEYEKEGWLYGQYEGNSHEIYIPKTGNAIYKGTISQCRVYIKFHPEIKDYEIRKI